MAALRLDKTLVRTSDLGSQSDASGDFTLSYVIIPISQQEEIQHYGV